MHRERVGRLLAQAKASGDPAAALSRWQEALALLPPGSVQHRQVADHVARLTAAQTEGEKNGPLPGVLAGLGAFGLMLWKFKFLLVGFASKAKFLLLGLTKAKSFFGIAASLGLYWAAWGWPFALGLVVSIYIHELGHVFAMWRYGLNPSPPMFLPGFGAYVRGERMADTAAQRGHVGLSGPWAGLVGALLCWGLGAALGSDLLLAVARVGAWINILNLIPVWHLDGARAMEALTRAQRGLVAAAALGAWVWSEDTWVLAVAALAGFRALGAGGEGDRGVLVSFVAVLLALSAVLAQVQVATPF